MPIPALLFTQGIRKRPSLRSWSRDLDALRTGDGRALPPLLRAELDRLRRPRGAIGIPMLQMPSMRTAVLEDDHVPRQGIGNDRRSRSSTQGEIRYRLVPIEQGTRVDLSIGYTLTGMLAQVGRPGLVRDLAGRLIAEFAGNLDRRLSGTSPGDATTAELNGMALIFSLLRARVARWVGRFASDKDGAT